MRLISNYKDYYDVYARDRNLSDQLYLWERKTVENHYVKFAIPNPRWYREQYLNSKLNYTIHTFVVWFCGEVVPVVYIENRQIYPYHYQYYYSLNSIPGYILSDLNEYKIKELKIHFSIGDPNGWMREDFKCIELAGCKFKKLEQIQMHLVVRSPVFMTPIKMAWNTPVHNIVEVNPNLGEIQFNKFRDPFSAFVQLEQYIGNNMAPVNQKLMHVIPDKINAESHGFDKFSFRKEASTNKKRRR